ncbi:MAG: hypothetical protein ACK5VV_03580 [Lysobacteraceae bacterium]
MHADRPPPRPDLPAGSTDPLVRSARAAEHEAIRQLAAEVARHHRERSYAGVRYAG